MSSEKEDVKWGSVEDALAGRRRERVFSSSSDLAPSRDNLVCFNIFCGHYPTPGKQRTHHIPARQVMWWFNHFSPPKTFLCVHF